MKISWKESDQECRNCGRSFPVSRLDRRFWCPDCRAVVIRRATLAARLIAFTVTLILAIWIYSVVGSQPRFLMIYIIMLAVAYFFIYKLTQRVAFEVFRGRGVPPPIPQDDE